MTPINLPPHLAFRWSKCAAAMLASLNAFNVDEQDHKAAETGKAMHDLAKACLQCDRSVSDFQGDESEAYSMAKGRLQGDPSAYDFQEMQAKAHTLLSRWKNLDEDQLAAVSKYVDYCPDYVSNTANVKTAYVEHGFSLECVMTGMSAIPDFVVIDNNGFCRIIDFKTGRSRVHATGNHQLTLYALAVLQEHPDIKSFTLEIFQPTCYDGKGDVSNWIVSADEIRSRLPFYKRCAIDAQKAETATTGDHCKYCPSIASCSTAAQAMKNAIELLEVDPDFTDSTPDELYLRREVLQQILTLGKSQLATVEQTLKHKLENGQHSHLARLKVSSGAMKWADDKQAINAVAAMYGIDISQTKALTPTQTIAKLQPADRETFNALFKDKCKQTHSTSIVSADDESRQLTAEAFG